MRAPLLLLACLSAALAQNIQQLRARLHPHDDAISVEWTFVEEVDHIVYNVRYRVEGETGWRTAKTTETQIKLDLPPLPHDSKLQVQVQAERLGQVIEDWTRVLLIQVARPVGRGGARGAELRPPEGLRAILLSATSARIEWQGGETGAHHLVHVKQLTSRTSGNLQRQQIKTSATSFTLAGLISGEQYEITVRSASGERVSPTAAIIEITLLHEHEFVEIDNLVINSHLSHHGVGRVALSWQMDQKRAGRVQGYEVLVSEANKNDEWRAARANGTAAVFEEMKSDTEYVAKIRSSLRDGSVTESGVFKFRTPRVERNPIHKVDVIYSDEVNAVQLKWILEPHVRVDRVAGYDVYISENKERAESEWQLRRLSHPEASLSLSGLRPATVYYARVALRYTDGTVARAPALYRFKTSEYGKQSEDNLLSYRNVGYGEVNVTWTNPSDERITGHAVMYSDRRELPTEQWQRIMIRNPLQHSVVLSGLRPSTEYHVQIIPRVESGAYQMKHRQHFQLKTDEAERWPKKHSAAQRPF